jgi:dimethylargininase
MEKAMYVALTRPVSASIGQCELTHLDRQPIDVDLARAQHHRYEEALAALGCRVERLPEEPNLPDAVFVEDAAIVLDELAIVTRPGAASRRPETRTVARALERYRPLATIEPPGTLDGGDVLRVGPDEASGKTLYVGLSQRSSRAAVEQMRTLLAPLGYSVRGVPVRGCLHLKSAVTQVAEDLLLINRGWVDGERFDGLGLLDVDPSEPYAANALRIDGTLVYAAAYPRTRERLEARGIAVSIVDLSELAKAEGAVTCCSLIVPTVQPPRLGILASLRSSLEGTSDAQL